MADRYLRSIVALALLALALPASAQDRAGFKRLPGGNYDLFLTDMDEAPAYKSIGAQGGPKEVPLVVKDTGATVHMQIPGEKKLKFGWSDQYVVLHIPFFLPQLARPVLKYQIYTKGFGYTGKNQRGESEQYEVYWKLKEAGIYRLDDHELMKHGFHRFAGKYRSVRFPTIKELKDGKPQAGPTELKIIGSGYPPGMMVLYVALKPSHGVFMQASDKPVESVTGEFVVEFTSAVGWDPVNKQNVEFPVPKKRSAKIEFRHNGWELQKPTVRLTDKKGEAEGWPDRYNNVIAQDVSTQYASEKFTHKSTGIRFPDADKPQRYTFEVELDLPRRQYDNWPVVPFKGREILTNDGSYDLRNTGGRFAWDLESVVGFRAKGYGFRVHGVKEGDSETAGKLVDAFELENDTAYKHWLRKAMPWDDDSLNTARQWRDALKVDDKEILRFEIECGSDKHWKHVTFKGRRLSEITSNVEGVDSRSGATYEREAAGDDKFWEWKALFLIASRDAARKVSKAVDEMHAKAEEIRDLEREIREAARGALPQVVRGDNVMDTRLRGEDLDWERYRFQIYKTLNAKRAELEKERAEQLQQIVEDQKAVQRLVRAVDEQIARSKRKNRTREGLEAARKQAERMLKKAEFSLLEAAGWPREGRAAYQKELENLETMNDPELGPYAAVMLASLHWRKAEEADIALMLEQDRREVLDPPPPPDTKLANAARWHRREALLRLRDLLAKYPRYAMARIYHARYETWWLNRIARRLDMERQMTYRDFQSYLEARGFNSPDAAWEDMYAFARSTFGFISFAGPGKIALGLIVPDYQENYTSQIQKEIATCQVSILLMKKLMSKGIPLAYVKRVRKEDVANIIGLRSATGNELPLDRTWRMVQDMVWTYQNVMIRNVRLIDRLATAREHEQLMQLEELLSDGEGVYDRLDPSLSTREMIGDFLFSPAGVAMFWIGAPTGGQAYIVGGLERLGATRLGSAFLRTRLARRVATLLADERHFYTALKLHEKATAFAAMIMLYGSASMLCDEFNLYYTRQFVDLLAMVGAHEIAGTILAKAGLRPANAWKALDRYEDFLERRLQMLRKLDDDVQVISKKVKSNGIVLANEEFQALQDIQTILSRYDESLTRMVVDPPGTPPSGVFELVGEPMFPRRSLEERLAASFFSSEEALSDAAKQYGRAVSSNVPEEAEKIQAFVGKVSKELKDDAADQLEKTSTARAAVKSSENPIPQRPKEGVSPGRPNQTRATPLNAADDAAVSPSDTRRLTAEGSEHAADGIDIPAARIPKPIQSIAGQPEGQRMLLANDPSSVLNRSGGAPDGIFFGDRAVYQNVAGGGKKLQLGDELMRQHEYEKAIDYYHGAAALANEQGQTNMLELATQRVKACQIAKAVKRWRDAVSETIAGMKAWSGFRRNEESYIKRLRLSSSNLSKERGVNPSYIIPDPGTGEPAYIFKHFPLAPEDPLTKTRAVLTPEQQMSRVRSEVIGAAMVNEVAERLERRGIKGVTRAPAAMHVRIEVDGKMVDGVVTRFVDSKACDEVGEGVLMASGKEYGIGRVIRTWLGDPDGKVNNQMLAKANGAHVSIDFDMAHLSLAEPHPLMGEVFGEAAQKKLMTYGVNTPLFPSVMRDLNAYSAQNRLDAFFTLDEVLPAAQVIQEICDEPGRLETLLGKYGFEQARVNEAAKALRLRGRLNGTNPSLLEEVIVDKFSPTIDSFRTKHPMLGALHRGPRYLPWRLAA